MKYLVCLLVGLLIGVVTATLYDDDNGEGENERWIDGNKLIDTLIDDYDIEDTQLLRIVIKEIANAPIVARTKIEYWRMRMRVQGRRIDKRFENRPIAKEKNDKIMIFIAAVTWLLAILGVIGLVQLWYFWMH